MSKGAGATLKPFFLYMLECADGSYYIGHTDDLANRIAQHHAGLCAGYTAKRRPLELVWVCEFTSRLEALERERQIKGWSRAKKEALIRGDWQRIHELARRRSRPSTPAGAAAPASAQDERIRQAPRSP